MNDQDIERRIDEFFDANYRRLLVEGGAHVLTPRALEQARQQVELYWKKLREIAVNVTETEVRLQLPNRRTRKGRTFVIEGVVDLVREAGRVRMYDIKTHHCGEVLRNRESYAAQLNVYAYIWRELRGQELHEMGIIAVQLPEGLRLAIRDGRKADIKRELGAWNPLVPIPFSRSSLDKVFQTIADTVDKIEDGAFSPPPVSVLASEKGHDTRDKRPITFATLHCRNCDGRFSCDSYREFMQGMGGRRRQFDALKYLGDARDDGELDEWIDGNIALDLDRLFPEETEAAAERKPRKAGPTERRGKPGR